MDKQLLINILKFAPLGILLFFTIIYLLWGMVRGFRKSLILFIHAIVIGVILLIVYEVILSQPSFDSFVLTTAKNWVDFTKEPFYAPSDASTMTEVIESAIVHNVDYGEGLELIVKDNGAYLATLASVVLHLALAVVFFVVYFILIFIAYIIYLIFYPQGRYARKKRKKHEAGEGKPYNKHTFLGGLIGGVRGLLVSIVWLSFIGGVLFVAAGTGDDREDGYKSIDFTDNKVDSFYEAFDIINCYGSTGVFKVLNSVKDSNNVPVYLFAANMVLHGSYNDVETNKQYNLYLLRELNNYQEFASGVYKIILKYDTDNLLGTVDTKDNQAVLDAFITIISKEGVQAEVDKLIDNFNGDSFFVDFGLSMVDSIAAHLNQLKFYDEMDAQLKGLLDVLLTGDDAIKVSNLLTKDDTKLLANAVIKALKAQVDYEGELDASRRIILYTKAAIDDVKQLSFLKDDVKNEKTGRVLKNLYEYASTSIDSEFDFSGIDLTPKQWVGELESLLDAVTPALDLYDTVYDKDLEPLEMIDRLFPEDNPELAQANEERYDVLCETLSKSNLLDGVMSLSVVRNAIDDMLTNINPEIKLPSKIQFVDKDDQRGEAYHLLTSLKQLIKTGTLTTIIDISKNPNKETLSALADALTQKDDQGKTIVENAVESTIVKYLISGVVLNLNVDGFEIIVPESATEVDEEGIKIIKKSELNNTVDALPGVLEVIKDTDNIDFAKLLKESDDLLESNIIEATLIYNLAKMVDGNDYIVIPNNFKEAATKEALNDLDANIWHTSGEINNIIDALDELLEISKADSFNFDNAVKAIAQKVFGLNNESITDESLNPETGKKYSRLDVAYRSEVLKASISKVLDDYVSGLMDSEVLTNPVLCDTDDYGVKYYKESEISKVLYGIEELGFEDLETLNADSLKEVLTKDLNAKGTTTFAVENDYSIVEVLYSSYFVKAILIEQLDKYLDETVVNEDVRDSKLVKEIDNGIKIYKLSEIQSIAECITELGVKNFDKIADSVLDVVFNLNQKAKVDEAKLEAEQRTKLNVLYGSNLIKSAILKQLDNNLNADLVSLDLRDSTLVKDKIDTQKLDDTAVSFYLYKESEISNIIQAAGELGISTMDDLNNQDKITNNVFSLFETSTTDPSKEKIEIIYKSNIIKSAVSTKLDDSLADLIDLKIRDSKLAKEQIEVTKIEDNSTAYVNFYLESEIKKIIDGVKELGIDDLGDLDNPDNIISNFLSLTDEQIDKINQSYIVRGILANQLDENIGDSIIDLKVRDSLLVKEKLVAEQLDGTNENAYLYSNDEIKTLIKSAKELDINSIDDFTDVDVIKSKIFTLSDTAITDSTKKKMHVLYSSNIIKSILTKQLDSNISSDIVADEVKNSLLVKDKVEAVQISDASVVDVYLYKNSEVYGIINSAEELGVDTVDDFNDTNTIKNKIFSLYETAETDNTKSKIAVMYDSYIIKSAFTKQLDANLDDEMLNPAILETRLVKAKYETTNLLGANAVVNLYKDSEVYGIIDATRELGIESFDGFDANSVKNKIMGLNGWSLTDSTKSKLQILYNSFIIQSVISKQLDNNLNSTFIDLNVRDSSAVKQKYETTTLADTSANIYLYLQNEVKGLIASADELGIESLGDFDADAVKGKIKELNGESKYDSTISKLDVIYSSYLIKSILTTQLDANVNDENRY